MQLFEQNGASALHEAITSWLQKPKVIQHGVSIAIMQNTAIDQQVRQTPELCLCRARDIPQRAVNYLVDPTTP